MREDKKQKEQKPAKVANPDQPLKDQGDDLEAIIPHEPLRVDRPTRDDGDNDDEGALGSGPK